MIYELSVWKVVDSKGIVWENPDPDDKITVAINGRKGFAFDNDFKNKSVQELISRIAEEAGKQGLDLGMPQVFIQDHLYCLLRYVDVDVRVKLTWGNRVDPCIVRFAFYAPSSDTESEEWIAEMREKIVPCICAAVLTDIPYNEVVQKTTDYVRSNKEHIEFDDPSYTSVEGLFLYNDENGNLALFDMIAVGKGLSDFSQPLKL